MRYTYFPKQELKFSPPEKIGDCAVWCRTTRQGISFFVPRTLPVPEFDVSLCPEKRSTAHVSKWCDFVKSFMMYVGNYLVWWRQFSWTRAVYLEWRQVYTLLVDGGLALFGKGSTELSRGKWRYGDVVGGHNVR